MLCEGIMLFLLLVVVFSKMSKQIWPLLLIGYGKDAINYNASPFMTEVNVHVSAQSLSLHTHTIGLPIPIVAITVGARHDYYGVRDACGELKS